MMRRQTPTEQPVKNQRAPRPRHVARRAFSLVEVLLAILILSIGIVSIAALFPAGIAQQRLAADDIMGPTVANHAMSVIRSKVRPEDFLSFDDFGGEIGLEAPTAYYTRTTPGDWGWMRPGFILGNAPSNLRGAIDIFSHYRTREWFNTLPDEPNLNNATLASELYHGWPDLPNADEVLFGIPYNFRLHNFVPPPRIITQRERFYPMQSQLSSQFAAGSGEYSPQKPQYVWDCMFRRYQGRVYVAIFVYRVSSLTGAEAEFATLPNPDAGEFPPMPVRLDFVDWESPADVVNQDLFPYGPWDVWYAPNAPHRPIPYVPGLGNADNLDFTDPRQSWQETRQWLLDQNNNIHRVHGRRVVDGSIEVELSRPLLPVNFGYYRVDTKHAAGFSTPFSNWPAHSTVAAEYFANPPGGISNGPEDSFSYPVPGNLPLSFLNSQIAFDRGVVTRIWYVPRIMQGTLNDVEVEYRLTPVYVAVKEL